MRKAELVALAEVLFERLEEVHEIAERGMAKPLAETAHEALSRAALTGEGVDEAVALLLNSPLPLPPAERRSAGLAERCQGATTPALQAIEVRGLLTPAERQVALLAAAGRANRDIAAALFLSPRTVENRHHRIYEKLGISGRAELTAALQP